MWKAPESPPNSIILVILRENRSPNDLKPISSRNEEEVDGAKGAFPEEINLYKAVRIDDLRFAGSSLI